MMLWSVSPSANTSWLSGICRNAPLHGESGEDGRGREVGRGRGRGWGGVSGGATVLDSTNMEIRSDKQARGNTKTVS